MVAVGVLMGASLASAQTWQESVDYLKLQQRVGAALPTGAGVSISQVEGGGTNTIYYVDPTLPQFNGSQDSQGTPVTFIDGSGLASNGISSHTSIVGARFYGDGVSLAPGANSVTIYEAGHWLTHVLRYNTGGSPPPLSQDYRVQNHSWVATLAPSAGQSFHFEHPDNVKVLQRYDWLIDTANNGDGMTAVVGLNNNGATPLPYLLTHSYNAIAVGKSDGVHSIGLTLEPDATAPDSSYGPGRSKPELVAPLTSSSLACGAVSSAATMLYQSGPGAASKNEVMKSVLLAGATKTEFPAWTRTSAHPLDDKYGAGELNVYNSYLIQRGGQRGGTESPPTSAVGAYGWDYQNHKGHTTVGDVYYNFQVPEESTAQELSIILSWNLKVTDSNLSDGAFTPIHSLQNMDLRFYDSTGGFLGTLLDQSTSAVDNVEHLYFTDLGPGTYTLKVSGAANWDFGLAWRTATLFDEVSADFNRNGIVDGGDFITWQQNYGKLLGALAEEGDADGDGDVDDIDLAAWKLGLIATPAAQFAAMIAAVPEPSSGDLAALAAGMLLVARFAYVRRQAA